MLDTNHYIKHIVVFFVIAGFMSLWMACTDQPCYENVDTPIVIGFYKNNGLQMNDTTLDSLRIIADNANYGLRYVNVSQLNQFLNPNSNQTEFAFIFDTIFKIIPDSTLIGFDVDSNWTDTLLFEYDTISCDTLLQQCEIDTIPIDTSFLNIDTLNREYAYFDSIITRQVIDNVILKYTQAPHLISHDCGFAMYFERIQVNMYTKNYIDTIVVVKQNITNVPQENIQIRF